MCHVPCQVGDEDDGGGEGGDGHRLQTPLLPGRLGQGGGQSGGGQNINIIIRVLADFREDFTIMEKALAFITDGQL